MSKFIKATVFIPTYNGEKYIGDILSILFKQDVPFDYEVLIIDSGSTDKTVSIINRYLNKYKNLKLEYIDNKDFGHGKTRNYAAELSNGEIMVYLSHDAVPASKTWLYEMVKPFDLNDKIMGVVGKQKPRPKCVPLLKYEIRSVFRSLGPDSGTTVSYKDSFMRGNAMRNSASFYSDVNSAVRREFLLSVLPYRDVRYAEDYIFGKDLLEKGYMKAYASRGEVIHSNDLTLTEYKHRIFDETVGIRKIGVKVTKPSYKHILKMVVLGSLKDSIRTVLDREYSPKRKLYWLFINPLYHIEKWKGYRKAAKFALLDEDTFNNHSLEARRKK